MELNICMSLSTAHMTEQDNDILMDMSEHEVIISTGYGFMIWLDEDWESIEAYFTARKLSGSFIKALHFVYMTGARLVNFDRDTKPTLGLDLFCW